MTKSSPSPSTIAEYSRWLLKTTLSGGSPQESRKRGLNKKLTMGVKHQVTVGFIQ
jgi:hypothetical protein